MPKHEIVRVAVAVKVTQGDAKKFAKSLRESDTATKIAQYLANIAGPSADSSVELEVVENEHLSHACDWYVNDDCDICRFASAYSLEYTQDRHFRD